MCLLQMEIVKSGWMGREPEDADDTTFEETINASNMANRINTRTPLDDAPLITPRSQVACRNFGSDTGFSKLC